MSVEPSLFLSIHFFALVSLTFRTNSLIIEEAATTVYLKVTRSNGINTSVSVEWETLSDTAFGISKLIHELIFKSHIIES